MTSCDIEVAVGVADTGGRKTAILINDGAKVLVRLETAPSTGSFQLLMMSQLLVY